MKKKVLRLIKFIISGFRSVLCCRRRKKIMKCPYDKLCQLRKEESYDKQSN